MHAVVAARTFWLCGTEKCLSDFATDGVCGGSSEERARSGLVWVFLDRSAVEVHDERARVVRLEPDHLVGPAVELEEQNAIDLVRAVVASSHTCKETFGRLCTEGQREAL